MKQSKLLTYRSIYFLRILFIISLFLFSQACRGVVEAKAKSSKSSRNINWATPIEKPGLPNFHQVTEVNLVAPIYWAIEMVARIAEDRGRRGLKRWEPEEGMEGVIVFLGSVSSQGNKGQISYAVAKAGLEGAAARSSSGNLLRALEPSGCR